MNPGSPHPGHKYQQPDKPEVQLVTDPPHPDAQHHSSADPYDFIMNPAPLPPKKKFAVSGGGSSLRGKVLKLLAGAVLLIIVLIVGARLAFGNRTGNASTLVSLAATQQEIVRVTTLGLQKTKNPSVLAFAQTAKLTVSSQNSDLMAYLKKNGVKYKPEQLSAAKDSTFDDKLTSAAANNQLDEVFLDLLKASLDTYKTELKKDYNSSSNQKTKDLLSADYDSITVLLK